MTRFVPAVPALAIVTLAACGDAPTGSGDATGAPSFSHNGNTPAVPVYRVALEELNGSGVTASATLQVRDGKLVVHVNAVGHDPDRLHPQHIHGFGDRASACPTAAQDADGDGVITIDEGAAAFGPVQVDLQPYPTPANAAGAITYTRAFDLSAVPFDPSDLPEKTMVLHGDFVGASYVASLPVACGTVEPAN